MKNTIDGRMKNIRIDNLLNLSEQVASEFRESNLGRITGVLFEEYEEGLLAGYTENYIKVYVKGEKKLLASINKVKLVDKYKDGCFGEIAEKG
jgi:threonylcarbamoyladenosine tRNA methylthiotransferase MtaB